VAQERTVGEQHERRDIHQLLFDRHVYNQLGGHTHCIRLANSWKFFDRLRYVAGKHTYVCVCVCVCVCVRVRVNFQQDKCFVGN
jgi:hypothetical protein